MAFLLLPLTSKNSFIHFLNSLLNEGGQIMKWMTLVLVAVMFFCGSALGANLSLKATWTPNTESDMAGYNLYRTDGTRTKINVTLIPFLTSGSPTSLYNFTVTVPDNSAGALTYVLTAVDTNTNESFDSTPASYSYNLDTIPPSSPKNLNVQK